MNLESSIPNPVTIHNFEEQEIFTNLTEYHKSYHVSLKEEKKEKVLGGLVLHFNNKLIFFSKTEFQIKIQEGDDTRNQENPEEYQINVESVLTIFVAEH